VVATVTRGPLFWRIYYGDGSHVRSEDLQWDEAPSDNVQAVLVFRLSPRGDCLHSEARAGTDEYRLEGHDEVKIGKWCTDIDRIMVDVNAEQRRQLARPIAEIIGGD